jgi:hypothetical protein
MAKCIEFAKIERSGERVPGSLIVQNERIIERELKEGRPIVI